MAQQQYGDSMAQDASNVANAAVQTANEFVLDDDEKGGNSL